jgi:Ca2+-binding RTX toxin-like protein
VFENVNEGTDEVRTSLALYSLGSNVENLTGTVSTGQELAGNSLGNIITGGAGNDLLKGRDGNDTLTGGAGSDWIEGGDGDDILIGGLGRDTLTGGGGADTFRFSTGDSSAVPATADRILDFLSSDGDKIDLSGWDANSTASGHQAFAFIGTNAFTGSAGELRLVEDANGTWQVMGDTNGDGVADFAILVTLANGQPGLNSSDFIFGGG